MEMSALPNDVSLPAYLINYTSGTVLGSLTANSSRSQLLTVLTHSTAHPPAAGSNSEQGGKGSVSDNGEDDDSFGEHYFHICIYIWACVVISSLIALSVVIFNIAIIYCQKWGCCGRSLTRWEVKRIPLKRFQKVEGEDSQEKCPICHEEFHEERLIRQLPCNHCYHSYCVDRWLVKMSNRCPLCKQRVSISLLCPWNKQRRKKESNGHMSLDMEASIDESPPLPLLARLTPSNWFGEEIMSGPSKFIIMRPGRPTRVIDIREKNKLTVTPRNCDDNVEESFQPADINMASCNCQHFDGNVAEQICKTDVCLVSSIDHSSKNDVSGTPLFEAGDILSADVQIPSVCSSRSCSISSEQPLLFQSPCNIGDESESHDLMQNDDAFKWSIALTPLVHSQEDTNSAQCFTHELDCKSLATNKETYQIPTVKTVVMLSSKSSSVLSCNMRTPDTGPDLANSFTNRTNPITKHSTISATLDWSKCLSEGRSLIPTLYNKRHTLPGKITESCTLLEFSPSKISNNHIHKSFRKSAAVCEKTTNS